MTGGPHGLLRQGRGCRNQKQRGWFPACPWKVLASPSQKSGAGSGSSNMSPTHTIALTALRRATSRIVATTSIRARDSFFCPSSGNDGKRRPRCQSAVCSSLSTTSPVGCGDLERRMEQPCHARHPISKLVIFVAPSSIYLVFPGFQCTDALFKTLVLCASRTISASTRSRALEPTISSRRDFTARSFFSYARALTPAHQNLSSTNRSS